MSDTWIDDVRTNVDVHMSPPGGVTKEHHVKAETGFCRLPVKSDGGLDFDSWWRTAACCHRERLVRRGACETGTDGWKGLGTRCSARVRLASSSIVSP